MSYSHIDGRLVAKPNQGPNAGKEFEFQSQTKASFDPGIKRAIAKGRRQRPIYTVTQAADPKISIEMSSAHEHHRWLQFLHGGQRPQRGATFTLSHVFTRPGVGTESWRFLKCQGGGPGYDSGDSGVTDKTEIVCEDAHLNGVTIYEDE
jgi:hypothetical protein